jgi:hypothetical protein
MRAQHSAPVTPATVTQVTSEAVLGIPERPFREWVRSRKVKHTRLGKLVVVELSDALAALRAEQPPANDKQPGNENDYSPSSGRRIQPTAPHAEPGDFGSLRHFGNGCPLCIFTISWWGQVL